jgi:chaperonin cofactor prefoldin
MEDNMFRISQIRDFELEAEVLVAHQLDLLAQIEGQLRAVHQTMRRIERLRNVNNRVGPELSNGARQEVLAALTQELNAVDAQLLLQHQSSRDMQSTIAKMQERLAAIKRLAEKRLHSTDGGSDELSTTSPE